MRSYKCCEGVPLHEETLQELHPFISEQLHREIVEVSVVQEKIFVSLLFGYKNCCMEVRGHGCEKRLWLREFLPLSTSTFPFLGEKKEDDRQT